MPVWIYIPIREGLKKHFVSMLVERGGGCYHAPSVSVETVGARQRMAHIDRI